MSSRKKTWIKSAFSSLEVTPKREKEDSVPVKRTRRTRSATALNKTESESTPKTKPSPPIALVDLTTEDVTDGDDAAPPVIDNWIQYFAPSNADELALHPKKLVEFRDWLRHCEALRKKHPAQICLLTGPSGVGKTATLRVLAKEAGYDLQEWINPVDCEIINSLGDQPAGSSYVGSQLEAFKSFLLRASRYKSLLVQQHKPMLLVEDFPNVLISDVASTFEDLLNEYVTYGKSPLVFIVADSKSRSLNISYKLFTDQLKAKLRIEHISFNPIATTIMQKAMKRMCTLMQPHKSTYKVPNQTVVDSIIVCAQGDIRNAQINLHFASLKGTSSLPTKELNVITTTTTTTTTASKGRKRKPQCTLETIGRDDSITIMHALGRVFNPKYNDLDELLHSPDELTEAFSTEPKMFTNFIHSNYLAHFRNIEDVVTATHDLAQADLMLKEYRDDSLALHGLNLVVRTCMSKNLCRVTGWIPVRGPKRIEVKQRITPAQQKLLGASYMGLSKGLYACDYSSFLKHMTEQHNSSTHHA